MQTKIQKWGNSYAVRLPKQLVVKLGLRVGTKVDVGQEEGVVIVKKTIDDKTVTFKDWKNYLIPMKSKKVIHVSDRVDEILYGKVDR